eukprot:TRINITY_DN3969_c0_g1_i1.p1 TRINITY_DN3969_c0_g1~~TRINITY_DN3969_c0_g1_i1.p1  ORF type:complete len:389 (-),score=78.48 TRINITY_DN3969_c0_g1_i1:105-1271(-)
MALWVALLAVLLVGCNGFSLIVTGDVNLNPNLPAEHINNFTYVWGSMLPVLRSADVLAINHESTLAGIKIDNPEVIQFEDPLHYLDTYGPKGVNADFVSQANNHQFDFSFIGMQNTIAALTATGLNWGGLGATQADVTKPRVVKKGNTDIAFFTLVIDECWVWNNGTLYLDACTCGSNSGPPPAYQCYAAGTKGIPTGLWYNFGITEKFSAEVVSTIGAYKKQNPHQLVVTFLHFGPNFQWTPYDAHTDLLRNISAVSDLVWGTSSHHIQRFEVYQGTPIIYGLGDLVFRHIVGVEDWCPLYAIPCIDYRPDLALTYKFEVANTATGPRIDTTNILAYPSKHDHFQTFLATEQEDIDWIADKFNALSNPVGTAAAYDQSLGAFRIKLL